MFLLFVCVVITFIDLAGHSKYIKTTIFGLSAHAADFAMLCIDAPSSVGAFVCIRFLRKRKVFFFCLFLVHTTREHFSYAITLDVPVFIVINKIDLCSKTSVQKTIECLTDLFKYENNSIQLDSYVVKDEEDLFKAAEMFIKKLICPIFAISCVTGENINVLKKFLNILPPKISSKEQERLSQALVEYRVRLISVVFLSGILHMKTD